MKSRVKGLLRLGAGGVMLTVPIMASALKFEYEGVEGSFDTTLSAGVSVRMEDPDDKLIGISNGGTARSVNDDDGNLNYDSGDIVSATIKATHDLNLQKGNDGVFARVNYFYDAAADKDRQNFGTRGRDRLVAEIELLDLFVFTTFQVGGRNLSLRAGNQVVNWGESTFIGNSINAINPVDVAKLRTPGSELKEALLPIPILWGSYSISDSLGIEALWIADFERTEIDPRGSFFSTSDILSDDGDVAFTGAGRRNDQHGTAPLSASTAALGVPRGATRDPSNEADQYGVALRYFAEALNSTEFGLYYLRYHSRTPFISVTRATDTSSTPARIATAGYFADFPSGIDLYGLSFNTDGPYGIALQGEYSYRPNQPVQLGGVELLLAALRLPGPTFVGAIDSAEGVDPTTAPTLLKGYRREKVHQAQTTATKAFGPTFGADQFTLLGEVGATYMELDKDLPFNGPGIGLPSCRNNAAVVILGGNGSCQEAVGGGYADRFSWGYRIVSRMEFENVIGPTQIAPRLVFAHDVNGVGPTFNQETKAVTLGIGFNYLQRWQADIGYTAFFGGRNYSGTDPFAPGTATPLGTAAGEPGSSASFSTSANPNKDRDFLAVSVSYAF